jgi:peptidoglycan-N-acetylglucosamine deacetylase
MSKPTDNRAAAFAAAVVLAHLSVLPAKADVTTAAAPSPQGLNQGGVVITFDDRNFDDWIKALPLLDKYGARATFFISGAIDRQSLDAVRQLQSHGHAIGVHGIHHLRAVEYSQERSVEEYIRSEILPQVEQLKAAGVSPTSFAYPNSRNNAATDTALLKVLRHLRTGSSVAPGEQVSAKDELFVPAARIGEHGCLQGKGIDFAPTREDRTFEQLDAALARAAKNREIIVLYGHGIASSGKGNHVTPEALERILRKAKDLQLPFYTFDQLP